MVRITQILIVIKCCADFRNYVCLTTFISLSNIHAGLVSSLEDDVLIFAYDNITLECGITEDYQSLYWYRNGTLIPTDASTYYVRESWDYFEGVYQCFVVASDGVVYQNSWRVFDYREFIKSLYAAGPYMGPMNN